MLDYIFFDTNSGVSAFKKFKRKFEEKNKKSKIYYTNNKTTLVNICKDKPHEVIVDGKEIGTLTGTELEIRDFLNLSIKHLKDFEYHILW